MNAYPGTQTHFCGKCHQGEEWPKQIEREQKGTLPKCPAGPCGVQLEGKCPLGVPHPPNGVEHIFGCALCRLDASAKVSRKALGL